MLLRKPLRAWTLVTKRFDPIEKLTCRGLFFQFIILAQVHKPPDNRIRPHVRRRRAILDLVMHIDNFLQASLIRELDEVVDAASQKRVR